MLVEERKKTLTERKRQELSRTFSFRCRFFFKKKCRLNIGMDKQTDKQTIKIKKKEDNKRI